MDWRIYTLPLAALAVLYLFYGFTAKTWDIRRVYRGADKRASTSKFQFFLWFVVIFAAYIAVLVARILANASPVVAPSLDQSLLIALGASAATAVLAKQVTTTFVSTGRLAKPTIDPNDPRATGGLFTADDGEPDLAKIELIGWTFVAIALFLWTVGQRLVAGGAAPELPGIDSTLLGLMGLGQAAYLGHKFVTTGGPTTLQAGAAPLAAPEPAPAPAERNPPVLAPEPTPAAARIAIASSAQSAPGDRGVAVGPTADTPFGV